MTHRLSPIRPTLTAAAWLVIMAVSKGGGGEGEEGRRERREERGNKEKGEERNDDEKVTQEKNNGVLKTRSKQLYAHLLVHSKECLRAPVQLRLH